MKVRMKTHISGTRNGVRWPEAGGEVVVTDTEGADLCSQGLAEPVAEKAERATAPKPEKRTTRKAGK